MVQDSPKSHLLPKIKAVDAEMRGALILSCMLHVGMVLLFLFGLPNFSKPKQLQESINVVEIVTVSDITNVKLATPKVPKPSEEQKKASAAAKPKPSLPAPKVLVKKRPIRERKIEPLAPPKPAPPPVAEVPKPKEPEKVEAPKEKEVVKQPETPQATPELEAPKEPEQEDTLDAFASVLKSVEKLEAQEPDDAPQEKDEFDKVEDFLSKANKESYQPGIPLSLSEIDAVRQQIMRNWTVLGGARDAMDMQVRLAIELAKDGTVTDVSIVDDSRYASDPFFRAMADSAVRAVKKSSPLKYLPAEKYEGSKGWHRMELTFDPSEMLY